MGPIGSRRFLERGHGEEIFTGQLDIARCDLGANGIIAAEVSAVTRGRSTSAVSAEGGRRNFLRIAHRMSVERGTGRIRLRQHSTPLLSSVAEAQGLQEVMEARSAGVRRTGGNRLGVAGPRRSDDQGTVGRGEKQVQTRPIGPNWGPSDRCTPMARGFHWELRSRVPTCTTSGWLNPHSRT